MRLSREAYLPSKYLLKVKAKDSKAIAYITDETSAMGFGGRRTKPDFWIKFKNRDRMEKRITQYFADQKEREERARPSAKKPHTLKVGNCLSCSWGYDQTNVTWYQVTEVVGKYSVKVREIHGKRANSDAGLGGCSDYVVPAIDSFKGPEKLRRADENNCIKAISGSASLWDGEPERETAWGYGH